MNSEVYFCIRLLSCW